MKMIVLLFVLALGSLARAEEPTKPASDPAGKEQKARALYDEGVRYYNLHEYDRAVEAFKEAYLLSENPALLYNIAQIYRQKGLSGCGLALRFYRSYLRQKPEASDRASVEARIEEMEECLRREESAGRTPVENPSTTSLGNERVISEQSRGSTAHGTGAVLAKPLSTPRSGRLTPLEIALVATGAGLLAAGGVSYGLARSHFNELQGSCPCPPEEWEKWRNLETTGYVLLGVGAATTTAGLIWWLVRTKSRDKSAHAPIARGLRSSPFYLDF